VKRATVEDDVQMSARGEQCARRERVEYASLSDWQASQPADHNRAMDALDGVAVPFRWDLVSPDQLGSLLTGAGEPDLWFLDSLVACAGKVVARGGDGDLFFVGRSLDSMFDLLSGALSGVAAAPQVHRLPLSFARKLRFVGVTARHKTSPNTFRWQQHTSWTRLLPARAVVNVSLDWPTWAYLADRQVKLTRSFTPERWLADAAGPDHGEPARQALAEAVALVGYGRSAAGRTELAQAISGEPGLAQPWLRSLITSLSRRS
jgi:hypothetical protein